MGGMENEESDDDRHTLNAVKGKATQSHSERMEENRVHFHFFDVEPDNVQTVLMKRQEIEHELSVSKVLRSPVVGYQPYDPGMCCRASKRRINTPMNSCCCCSI